MKTVFVGKLLGLLSIAISGACLAQAPVVEVQTDTNTTTQSLQQSNDLSTQTVSSFELEQRLQTLEQIVDSRTEAQQRMSSQIMELQSDIDEIRGSIELHNHQLEKLLERQRELFLELDRRFEGMQAQTTQLGNDISGGITTSAPVASPSQVNGEQEAYQAAVNLILKDQNYDAAIPAFQTFLSQYPNSALTANSHYWLGQLLFNKQNYTEAKIQFTQVANKFVDSPKRADSLLKLGLIEKATGNLSAANSLFEQVLKEYPDGTPARLASQQLAN